MESFMIVSHNNQKKIAVINDFSGFGRCSIAVSLPIISAMKIQCCPVPTSIFSNHTGFDSYFFEDYTDKMRPYIAEWRKLDLHFNGICTGFLGSEAQIGIVGDFLQEFGGEGTIVLIDPVMGDYGKPYPTYTMEMCLEMKKLEKQGIRVKISDVSDALSLPRPGVTRTVKDMEAKGYVKKLASAEDGRVTYLTVTEAGKALSEKYNKQYFTILSGYVDSIPDEDILCTIRTMEKFYKIMCERRIDLDK